jgi:hypothetical protein
MPRGVEVFVGLDPIDLRWSFDRLAGIAVERIGRDPRSRALFVFFGKRHAAVKVLLFDGTFTVPERDRRVDQSAQQGSGARHLDVHDREGALETRQGLPNTSRASPAPQAGRLNSSEPLCRGTRGADSHLEALIIHRCTGCRVVPAGG